MKGDLHDPKALIREAYRIPDITEAQCRTIFLAWALDVPQGQDMAALAGLLLARHKDEPADHPMTRVLQQASDPAPGPRRRGGRTARLA
ncbi:MAG: hypothetical protein IIX61_03465 [Loktanella sp.]|nr:hypothetical protein [Loktanella sp.]